MAKGILSKPPKKNDKKKSKAPGMPNNKYKGLNKTENELINQGMGRDRLLGKGAEKAAKRAIKDFDYSFNYQKYGPPEDVSYDDLPTQPVSGDFANWRQEQINLANQTFDDAFQDQFRQQNDQFMQNMEERGIPIGSQLYNTELNNLQKNQNQARRANLAAAMSSAGDQASQFFNVGTQARQGVIGERVGKYGQQFAQNQNRMNNALQQRYGDITDLQTLQGAMGGYANQAYGNQQQNVSQGAQAAAMMNQIGAQNAGAMARLQAENQAALARQQQQQAWYDQNMANLQAQGGGGGSNWAQMGQGLLSGVGAGLGKYIGGLF